jgi:hypothetical protein
MSNEIEVIIGLDNITDYSENLENGKEDLYSVLPEIKGKSDIIVLFKTKNKESALFASGNMDKEGKGFIMIVAKKATIIFNFLEDKYIKLLSLQELEGKDYSAELKSLSLLGTGLAQAANLKLDEDDNTD